MNLTEYMKFKSLAGGGGSGSSLPSVTAEDNGKVLAVVNGTWNKAKMTEVFCVTFTDDGDPEQDGYYTVIPLKADKTYSETLQAYRDGKIIVFTYNMTSVFATINDDSMGVFFKRLVNEATLMDSSEDGAISMYTEELVFTDDCAPYVRFREGYYQVTPST